MLAVPIKMYLSRYIYIYIYIYVNCITYICFNFVISGVKKQSFFFVPQAFFLENLSYALLSDWVILLNLL